MQISYSINLPRDALSVPVVRRICRGTMLELGVTRSCVSEIALAVTEACANVIQHSSDTEDDYEVSIGVNEQLCEIRVVDTGRGFDSDSLSDTEVDASSERGRGIRLMRALVDNVRFESEPEAGTIVHLQKRVELEPASPLLTLQERRLARGTG